MMPSGQIPIHPTKGLDPRLTYCRRCKCKTNERIVGDNRLMTATDGQTAIAPKGQTTQIAKKLGWTPGSYTVKEVPPGRLPATELCDSCNEELAQFDEIVKAGGVHWRCLDCGLSGTIGKSDYADMLRDYMEIKPPVPCGVEFETCKEHLDAGIAHDGADNKEE